MKRLIIAFNFCFLLCISCKEKPSFIGFTYPDGKYKALVLSYDDGGVQDIELAHLFDTNNLVGTFNLNSGYLGVRRGWPQKFGDTIFQKYIPKDSLLIVYKNHEIAAHGAFHKNFTDITNDEVLEEINKDLELLSKLTNRKIVSMAYPFGNTNDTISQLISKTGIINGRTVADTHSFDLPKNYMMWNPTCHDSKVLEHLEKYIKLNKQDLSLFYVWGHSWEFGDKKRWENMVEFCKKIGNSTDIWSVGNGELTQYLMAIKEIQIDSNRITNPADNKMVWLQLSDGIHKLEAGESIEIN